MESMYSSFVEGLLNLPDLAYAWVTAQAAARRADRPTNETDEPPRALQRRRGNNDGDDPMEADDAPEEEDDDAMADDQQPLAGAMQGVTAGALAPAQAVEGSGEGAAPRLRSYARTLEREKEDFGVAVTASAFRWILLDFEATGKAIKYDEPIQLAFLSLIHI